MNDCCLFLSNLNFQ